MSGEKEVVLKLRAMNDPRNKQMLDELGNSLKKAQADIFAIERRGTSAMVSSAAQGVEQANKKVDSGLKSRVDKHKAHYESLLALDKAYQQRRQQIAGQLGAAIGKVQAGGGGRDAAEVTTLAAEGQKLIKEHERVQKELTRLQRVEAGKRLGEELRAKKAEEEAARASLMKRLDAYKKAKAQEAREAEKAEKDAQRILQREVREVERNNARIKAENAKRAAQEIRDQEKVAAARAAHQATVRSATREMLETAGESSEAIMKIMRGTVALGLVGEKDLDKIRDKLLQMQAAMDLMSGSVKIILNLEKAMSAYRTATIAAAAAQATLNATQGAGSAQGLGGALGQMVGGRLRSARNLLAGGAAANVAGAAAGSVAGRVAGGAGVAAAGTAATTGAGASFVGSVVAPLAALGVAIVGLKNVIEGRGEIRQETMLGRLLGGASRIGGRVDQYLGLNTAAGQAADNADKTARIAKRSEFLQAGNAADREAILAAEQEIMSLKERQAAYARDVFETELAALEPAQKRGKITEEIRKQDEEIKKLTAERAAIDEGSTAERALKEDQINAAQERAVNLAKQAQAIEREIAQAAKEAARQKLSDEKEVLRTLEQQLASEKDKYKSAEERFATMDKSEQAEVLRLNTKMQSGQELRGDEIQKLSAFKDLPGFKDKFDESVSKSAKASGFEAIGGEAAQSISETEAKIKSQKDVVAQLETQINVTIEADAKKVEKAMADQVDKAVKEWLKPIFERVGKLEGNIESANTRIRNRATGG